MSYTGLVERPDEAINVLRGPYRQLDEDGVIVGVSRQAICETLAYLDAIEALTRPVDVEAVARAIAAARCDAGRPDPGKGLDEFIAQAALAAMETPHADG